MCADVRRHTPDASVVLAEALLVKEKGRSAFSRFSIIIEVQAPEVPDLTVIDLPGIVRTNTDGQVRKRHLHLEKSRRCGRSDSFGR